MNKKKLLVFFMLPVVFSCLFFSGCGEKKEEYTVRFFVDDEIIETKTYSERFLVEPPAVPAKEGKQFAFWYVESEPHTPFYLKQMIKESVDLHACYQNLEDVRVFELKSVGGIEKSELNSCSEFEKDIFDYFSITFGTEIRVGPYFLTTNGRVINSALIEWYRSNEFVFRGNFKFLPSATSKTADEFSYQSLVNGWTYIGENSLSIRVGSSARFFTIFYEEKGVEKPEEKKTYNLTAYRASIGGHETEIDAGNLPPEQEESLNAMFDLYGRTLKVSSQEVEFSGTMFAASPVTGYTLNGEQIVFSNELFSQIFTGSKLSNDRFELTISQQGISSTFIYTLQK